MLNIFDGSRDSKNVLERKQDEASRRLKLLIVKFDTVL